jgi:hypothetical protein
VTTRLLLLLAMLFMPFGMASAPASTAPHAQSMEMPMGHCDEQRPHHGLKAGIAECTMACAAALPAVNSSRAGPHIIVCTPVRPSAARQLHGMDPEIATPPPKNS